MLAGTNFVALSLPWTSCSIHYEQKTKLHTGAQASETVDTSRPCKGTLTVTLSDFLAAVSVRFEEGKRGLEGRTEKSVKADMEGGGEEYVITTCDFILNSKCAKIIWRLGCAGPASGY